MQSDDEVEQIAMKIALDFEHNNSWQPEDVGAQNLGYDIRSMNNEDFKRSSK